MGFSTYIGVTPVSVPLDSTAVARGLRVKRGSNGLYTIQDATARGEYVTLNDGVASDQNVEGAALGTPARVPMQVAAAVAVGDLAYSAAAGQVTNVSTSAVLIGKFADAQATINGFSSVDLFTVL